MANATIHYRRLEDINNAFGTHTLEHVLRHAMNLELKGRKIGAQWDRRAWDIPPSSEETLLMNVFHDGGSYFFGDLTLFSKGHMQALLSNQIPDTPTLSVEQQRAPEGKEYIHSVMYWLIIKNHALVIHTRSLGSKQLEEYLTWLLKDQTAILGDNSHVMLKAKFDSEDVGGELSDIRQIVVGGRARPVGVLPTTRDLESIKTTAAVTSLETLRPWPTRALDVLRAVMTNEADVQKLVSSVPEDAELEVSVHIGYKTNKRGVSRAPPAAGASEFTRR